MVKGLEKFKEYFAGFEDNYVIIGGTACDIALSDTDMRPRATDDIDMILVIEKMSPEFGKRFWDFIVSGEYKTRQFYSSDRIFPTHSIIAGQFATYKCGYQRLFRHYERNI